MANVEVVRSSDAPEELIDAIRSLLLEAFGEYTDDDWDHTLGGHHVVVRDPGVVAHAAVVSRSLRVGDRLLRAGYVEGVATEPARQREGLGSLAMGRVGELLREHFEIGALSTSRHTFYERLGWRRWQGPSFVRRGDSLVRTVEEDAGIMVLPYGPTRDVRLTDPICCEARQGDDW